MQTVGKDTPSFEKELTESSCLYSIVLLRLRELDVEVVVVTLLVKARERVSNGRGLDRRHGLSMKIILHKSVDAS